jgi:hypothetical protein
MFINISAVAERMIRLEYSHIALIINISTAVKVWVITPKVIATPRYAVPPRC